MQNEVTPIDHQREHLRKAMHALATANDESIAPRWQVDHLREAVTELIEFARLSLPSGRTAYKAFTRDPEVIAAKKELDSMLTDEDRQTIALANDAFNAQDRTVSEGELSMALSNIIVRVNDPESADIKTLLVTLNEMDPEMYQSTVRKMIFEKAKEGTKIAVKTPASPGIGTRPIPPGGPPPYGACYQCERMIASKEYARYDTASRGPYCIGCYNDLPPEFQHEEETEDEPIRNTSGGPQI